jgi:hypothetical protein
MAKIAWEDDVVERWQRGSDESMDDLQRLLVFLG